VTIETITVPDLGGAADVEVIEVSVAVGDELVLEQTLLVLESDKASMEIPAAVSGKLLEMKLTEGDIVNAGDVIGQVETATANAVEEPPAPKETVEERQPEQAAPVVQAPLVAQAEAEIEVLVPDLGGGDEVEVIEINVAAGDVVAKDDSLIVLESDKASMEIPSPASGTVVELKLALGDKVAEGALVLTLLAAGDVAPVIDVAAASAPVPIEPAIEVQPKIEATPASTKAVEPAAGGKVYAGPAVRKLAREFGVALDQVSGGGRRGRLLKEDIQAYVKSALTKPAGGAVATGSGIPAMPDVDFSKFGPVRQEKMSRMHKLTANNMARSWLNVPHVTQFDDIDITELESFRADMKAEAAAQGVKLTPVPFLLKACAAALKSNPKINVSLHNDGEQLVYKQYIHIGMAVDTPAGLVVPVIRNVDQKGVYELAAEINELAAKAKDRKLTPDDMSGGCFTLSSLGSIGGKGFTPIVNAPEVAILGVSKLAMQPVWDGSAFQPRKMLPVSLSYDHRAVNGGDGGRFLTDIGRYLADVRRLLL
jgi:pyruvate dehydrogenase E2 component (dihydrolipoamide acetyltransferase)